MAQQTLGNGESGLLIRTKINENFTEIYDRNEFTDDEKTKLEGIEAGAEVNVVDSVNSQTGIVVLDADDISDATTTNKFTSQTDIDRLANTSGTNTGDQQVMGLNTTNEFFSYEIQTYGGYLYAIDCEITNRPGKMLINATGDTWQCTNELIGVTDENLTFGETDKTTSLELRLLFSDLDANTQSFGMSNNNFYSELSDTTECVTFIVENSILYAKTANGSAVTTTNISSGLTISEWNVYKIEFNSENEAKFYVNGVLKATHTTNLPTTSEVKFGYGGTTSGQSMRSSSIICIQEV